MHRTSLTAQAMNLALIICGNSSRICGGTIHVWGVELAQRSRALLATTRGRFHAASPSWTKWTACSSTRRARRWCLAARSEAGQADDRVYREAIQAANSLRVHDDYVVDVQERSVWLTEIGRNRCYEDLSPATTALLKRPWSDYVRQALHATQLLRREVDYVVAGDQVVLVDAMTGRLCGDRSWRDGLHQMVEVKEGLSPSGEGSVAAQITRQRYFRQYGLLCGMSGTVLDAAAEFYQTYGLRCAVVPPRQPSQRRMLAPRFFATSEAKYSAVGSIDS